MYHYRLNKLLRVYEKICKTCLEEKELDKFVNQNGKYRSKCKECKNKLRRTGRINEKRFTKGNIPWNKGKFVTEKRCSRRHRYWSQCVRDRDRNICQECGSSEKLNAHHIVPWKDKKELRFDVNNGLTLCLSCHGKKEGFQKGHEVTEYNIQRTKEVNTGKSRFKGKKHTEETKMKISETKRIKRENLV